MIIVRDVFQARYGKGSDLVVLFKEFRGKIATKVAEYRILTDASRPFFGSSKVQKSFPDPSLVIGSDA